MPTPLRIVFLGSDPIALPLLRWLAADGSASANVVGVFTQPDRPSGRGQRVQPNAIKSWALEHGLPVFQPEKLTPEDRVRLAELMPDLSLVMAYGQILREEFIGTPRHGTLNLHTSVLPKFRGASPIQTAVASGEQETGVSLMRIVRKLDAGPVAGIERVAIGRVDTAADVEAKLSAACVPLIRRALQQFCLGELKFTDQDDAGATYCRKLEKADGILDFSARAATLAARINGLFPWPACTIEVNAVPVKIGQGEAIIESGAFAARGAAVGTVLGADALGLCVVAGDGIVRLRRLQRPGGRMLEAGEFLRGFEIPAGTLIPSGPMTELVRTAPRS